MSALNVRFGGNGAVGWWLWTKNAVHPKPMIR